MDMGVVLVDGDGNPVGDDDFQIYPENAKAARVFYACETQWQRNAMSGQREGIPADRLRAVCKSIRIKLTPELFDDIQMIERAALGAVLDFPELDALNITRVEFDDGETIPHRHTDYWGCIRWG